ncbi:hypothetical protein LEN26_009473 [Aphanomyces euteiches]|nr:hypothetical protein LEN26_009473 [Aphanomyces euteiches]
MVPEHLLEGTVVGRHAVSNTILGGNGSIVEIDETSLKKKSKYNRGTQHQDYWLFGGVDRTTGKWFARLVYNDRTKPTLSDVIDQHIKQGTTIMSDKFASYVSSNGRHNPSTNARLSHKNFSHFWVHHSENFVDPATGAHTQTIEGLWEVRIKHRLKCMRGIRKDLLPSYVDEFLWRSWFFPRRRRPIWS